MKVLVYGLSTTGLVVGGSLTYANYDPSFRYKVEEYIPGFASLADFAADKWVDMVDTIKPRSTDKVGLKKDFGSVSESKLPKPKQTRIEKQAGVNTPSVEGGGVSKTPKEEDSMFTSKESSHSSSVTKVTMTNSKEQVSLQSTTKELSPQATEFLSSNKEAAADEVVNSLPPAPSSKESGETSINETTKVASKEGSKSSKRVAEEPKKEESSMVVDEKPIVIVEPQQDEVPINPDIVSDFRR